MKHKNNFKLIALISFLFIFTVTFLAQAEIVQYGEYALKKPDSTWYVIKFKWQKSDDGSGYTWTTWTESDIPGKKFGREGHFYPPPKQNTREQITMTVNQPDFLEGMEYDTKFLLSLSPMFKTQVIAQNNQLGVRIYFEDDERQVTDIPVLINLYEIETGKMIFEKEPISVGSSIKYFDLKNKINNKSMYSVTFTVAGQIDSRTAFYFNNDGTEFQKTIKD